MGLNINLFVHGVPKGQKIWGPRGEDWQYLSSFYGPAWNAPEVMKVDVMTFGGSTYVYYSFVKGVGVCDYEGRSGSFFAITLKMNTYYADVQNLYAILRAAYEKICVGMCVQESANGIRYLVQDFETVDAQLRQMEKLILGYIGEFSTSNDLVGLSGFPSNSSAQPQMVNLHECTRQYGLDIIRKSGRLHTSAYYLPLEPGKKIAQNEAEKKAAIQKARDLAESERMQAMKDVNLVKAEARKQVDEAENEIASLKNEIEELKKEIEKLEDKIDSKNKEYNKLRDKYNTVKHALDGEFMDNVKAHIKQILSVALLLIIVSGGSVFLLMKMLATPVAK